MKKRVFYVICAVIFMVGILVPGSTLPASAQPPEPPGPHVEPEEQEEMLTCQEGEPCKFINGKKIIPEEEFEGEGLSVAPRATGGPDDYGYTWDDSEPYNWIDARSGTDTGLSGDDNYVQLDIGFNFKFYENTYSQLYVNTNGLVLFEEDEAYAYGNVSIPNKSGPENFIAPFWDDLCVNYDNYNDGHVYYLSEGTNPNRRFVIEWYRVSRLGSSELLTFQVILHENGDIVMQYQNLNGYLTTSTVGIEDSSGTDGLQYLYNSEGLTNGTAIRYSYPPPSYRLSAYPLYQGDFTYAGEVDEFIFTVTNTGDLGVDTYDMEIFITPGGSPWNVDLYDANSYILLVDSDGDGIIDTGPIAQSERKEVLVRVTAPAAAAAGEGVKILLDVTSSENTFKTKTVTLESTIPYGFTQAYTDYSDWRLINELNYSSKQLKTDVTPEWVGGVGPAVAETPGHHFVNVWREYDYMENDSYGYRLKYAVVDRLGQAVQPATALSGLYGEPDSYTNMNSPSIAVTPDGKIGVLWSRYIRNASDQYNYNVWFAVLNSNGSLAYSPINLTNDNQWGNYQQGYNYFGNTKIEACADNRFMLAWSKGFYDQDYSDADVYYMIRNSNGAGITGGINMTADAENADDYSGLSLTALSGNKFYVFYNRYIQEEDYYYYLYPKYRVIDSSGGQIVGETNANLPWPWIEDSIQITGGNIILVNEYYDYSSGNVYPGYTILNGTNYNVIFSDKLTHPSFSDYSYGSLSVTKTPDGKAIITWMDEHQRYLYYALLHSKGDVLSGPVIFDFFEDNVSINTDGYAITTNSWEPASGIDIMAEFEAPFYGAAPGGLAGVQVSYGNQGLTTAANVLLSLTISEELSYSHDTSGVTPTIVGNTVTWDLSDLDFGDVGHFSVYLEVPSSATIGTFYNLSLEITSDGGDVDPSNNTDTCQVMAAELLFLPIALR